MCEICEKDHSKLGQDSFMYFYFVKEDSEQSAGACLEHLECKP